MQVFPSTESGSVRRVATSSKAMAGTGSMLIGAGGTRKKRLAFPMRISGTPFALSTAAAVGGSPNDALDRTPARVLPGRQCVTIPRAGQRR